MEYRREPGKDEATDLEDKGIAGYGCSRAIGFIGSVRYMFSVAARFIHSC